MISHASGVLEESIQGCLFDPVDFHLFCRVLTIQLQQGSHQVQGVLFCPKHNICMLYYLFIYLFL